MLSTSLGKWTAVLALAFIALIGSPHALAAQPVFEFVPENGHPLDVGGTDADARAFDLRGKIAPTGTLFVEFKRRKTQVHVARPRYFLTLRCDGRQWIGFNFYAGKPVLYMSHRNIGETQQLRTDPDKPLDLDRWYKAAMVWDGAKVTLYLDGVPVAEQEHLLQVTTKHAARLNLGPFKDGYVAAPAWGDNDIAIRRVLVFDAPLSGAAVAKLSGADAVAAKPRPAFVLAAAKVAAPPQPMDGVAAPATATGSVGLFSTGAPEKSFILPENSLAFAYDETNLYIDFSARFPADYVIQKGVEGDGARIWPTESFEFWAQVGDKLLRFGGNVAGGRIAQTMPSLPLKVDWEYRSTLSHQIDDTKLWRGKARIPLSVLGIVGPPAGREVRCNFARTWAGLAPAGTSSLSEKPSYNDTSGFGTLRFSSRNGALQVVNLEDPSYGKVEQKLSGSGFPAGCVYRVTLLDSRGMASQEVIAEATLPATEAFTLPVAATIAKGYYDTLLFEAVAKDGYTYLSQALPFKLNDNYLVVQPVLSQNHLVVKCHFRRLLGARKEIKKASVALVSSADNEISRMAIADDNALRLGLPEDLPAGDYAVLLKADGETVNRQTFHYFGEQPWQKPQYDRARIIPPFGKLDVDSRQKTASMFGRTYDFASGPFPAKIASKGEEVLRNGIALRVGGEPLTATDFSIKQVNPVRGEFSAELNNAAASASVQGWIENDGVVWYEVELAARKPGVVEFVIPYASGRGEIYHASAGGFGASGGTSGTVAGKKQFGFFPSFWVGDRERGVLFFAESANAWKASGKPITLSAQPGKAAVLRVRFADNLQARGKMSLRFGLMATPVKPLPKNYPLNTFGYPYPLSYNIVPGQEAPVMETVLQGGTVGDGFFDLARTRKGVSDRQFFATALPEIRKYGAIPIPYTNPLIIPEDYPEASGNRAEWQMSPHSNLPFNYNGKKMLSLWLCPASGAKRYYLYKLRQMLKAYDFGGLYYDFAQVRLCTNHLHGCDGRFPLLAMRDFYRGVAAVFVESGHPNYRLVGHASEAVQLPATAYLTHLYDGEHFRQMTSGVYHDGKDIIDSFPEDYFDSEFSSLPWGVTQSIYMAVDPLLPQFGGGKEEVDAYMQRITMSFLTQSLQRNTIPGMGRGHYGLFDKLVRIYANFGVPDADFFPFWRNGDMVQVVQGDGVRCGFFRNKEKHILMLISNAKKERLDQDVVVQFDPAKMGVNTLTQATEMWTAPDPAYGRLDNVTDKRRVSVGLSDFRFRLKPLAGNRIEIFIPAHSVALVWLR